MQPNGSFAICSMSFFLGMKAPKVNDFFVVLNARLPATTRILHPRQFANAFEAMLVRGFAVRPVLAVCRQPQIFKSVVRAISVDVINLFSRNCASNVKPDQPVRGIRFSKNLNVHIAATIEGPGPRANPNLGARPVPMKKSCFWVVAKQVGEFIVCQHSQILPVFGKD